MSDDLQRKEDFAEGQEYVDHSSEEPEPNFARGQGRDPVPGPEDHGSFDEGQSDFPDSPEKAVERRFSEGQEISPESE